jgi:PAS domain S-box-containing protein
MSSALDPLTALLSSMSEGVYMVDGRGRIALVNQRLLDLLDLPAGSLHPGDPVETLPNTLHRRGEYGSDEQYAAILRLLQEAPGRRFVHERTRSNGCVIEARGNPVPGGGFLVTFADVTAHRRAAEALRQSEQRFRDFTEAASDFQWETDAAFRIASVSQSYERLAARPFSDIIGRTLWEVAGVDDPDEYEPWATLVKLMRAHAPVREFAYAIIDDHGRKFYRRLNGRPVLDMDSRFIGYRFATRDETAEVEARHRAAAALRDYQAHLDIAMEAAKAAYWERDLVTGEHSLGPSYFAMLGYAEADSPRDRAGWLGLLHPEDAKRLAAQQTLLPNDASVHETEFRIRAADGSWRWLLSKFRAVAFDRLGRPTRLLGISTDITMRKEDELALRLAHQRAQLYLDVAGVILVVLDADHTVALVNRKGCEILGVSEAEAIGRNWFDAFAPEAEREEQRATYAAFLAGDRGPAQDIEMAVRTSGGEVRLVTWHDILLRDEDGRVIGALSSGEDITEQRAAERKRDELRALLEATAQASPDGVLVTDSKGRYLFWNNRFAEMWKLDAGYLRLRQSGAEMTPELLKPVVEQLEAPGEFIAKNRDMYSGRLPTLLLDEIALKDGRLLVRHAARVTAGQLPFAAVAWVYRDATDERKREAELAQAQRLSAVGQLSGGVAHELNNLLAVIGGNLELIDEYARAGRAVDELTGPALSAVTEGAELTQSLLAFSRQQPLAPRLTDLNQLITGTVKTLQRMLGAPIKLRFLPADTLWQTVVDPGQLQTALLHLATNARDAMPAGGSLLIETENKVLEETYAANFPDLEPGEYAMIAVSDDGLGMPPEVARRAFEPFFTTKDIGKGTGLGLSMVFGFMKQSRGHVAIYSEDGHGTTVRLYLPRAASDAELERPAPAVPASEADSERILLVEDEPAVAAVARRVLESLGYRVVEARNGPEAMAIVRSTLSIDLLFTDVMLPEGMNGAEIAEAARDLRPGLKVLFASGYTKEALIHQGRLDAGVALLQKPYRRKELAQTLRDMLAPA